MSLKRIFSGVAVGLGLLPSLCGTYGAFVFAKDTVTMSDVEYNARARANAKVERGLMISFEEARALKRDRDHQNDGYVSFALGVIGAMMVGVGSKGLKKS